MSPTPKSLILDLLATVRRGSVPVSALVAAAGLFEIGENRLRVALARLLSNGDLERDERGLYRLPASGFATEVRSWARIEERLRPWSGDWVAVHTSALPRGRPADRDVRARALRLLGFRTLDPGLEVRPDNLVGGVSSVRARLASLGLDAPCFRVGDLDPETEARARSLWSAADLSAGYRVTIARVTTSGARLPELPSGRAMVESFVIGGEAIRQLVLDPLLPEAIVRGADRRALVEAMNRYDRLGRRAWAGWLGRDRDDPDAFPAGVRGADDVPVTQEIRAS